MSFAYYSSLVETFVKEISPGSQLESSSRDVYFAIFSREVSTHSSKPYIVLIERGRFPWLASWMDLMRNPPSWIESRIEEFVMCICQNRGSYRSKWEVSDSLRVRNNCSYNFYPENDIFLKHDVIKVISNLKVARCTKKLKNCIRTLEKEA